MHAIESIRRRCRYLSYRQVCILYAHVFSLNFVLNLTFSSIFHCRVVHSTTLRSSDFARRTFRVADFFARRDDSSRRLNDSTTLRGDSSTRRLFAATRRFDDSSRRLDDSTTLRGDSSTRRLFAATHRLSATFRGDSYAADFARRTLRGGILRGGLLYTRRLFLAYFLVDDICNAVSCDAMDPRYTQHVSSTFTAVLADFFIASGLSSYFL